MRRFDSVLPFLAACVFVATLVAARPTPSATEAELRAYTECFAKALGVTPRWNLEVEVVRDSTAEMANTYGTTMTSALQLEAKIVYNLRALERDRYSARVASLHEVLHVVTGELAGYAFALDQKLAAVEAERLVRQMVRWPNWRGVCEKP